MVNVLVRDAIIDEYYYLLPRAYLYEKEKTYLGKLIEKKNEGGQHPGDSYQLKFENEDKSITENTLDFQDELELTSEQGISDDDNKNHSDGETKSTFIGKLRNMKNKLLGRGGSRKKTRRNRKSKKLRRKSRRKSRRKTNRRRGRR